MHRRHALALLAASAVAPTVVRAQSAVVRSEGEWRDEARSRTVPWLIRSPATLNARAPVVIFSHGLGGSRRGAAYYGEHLAAHGYVVVYLQHPGSDTAVWGGVVPDLDHVDRAALAAKIRDPRITIDRFLDVPFAVRQLKAMDAGGGPFAGKLDMARLGMSGHSFGALTTQAMAGQVFPNGRSMPEPAFKAFIAMSPSGDARGDDRRAFAGFKRPFLSLTGTDDGFNLNGPPDVERRLRVFRALPEACPASQMVLNGGDHMVFSGRAEVGKSRPKDARFHALVQAASLSFWDAYLRDDDKALAYLRDGGLQALAGADATVESRGPRR